MGDCKTFSHRFLWTKTVIFWKLFEQWGHLRLRELLFRRSCCVKSAHRTRNLVEFFKIIKSYSNVRPNLLPRFNRSTRTNIPVDLWLTLKVHKQLLFDIIKRFFNIIILQTILSDVYDKTAHYRPFSEFSAFVISICIF